MSTIKNNASHLGAGAHPSNNRYCLQTANDTSSVSTVSSTMGGMVSAITAVLCGTARRSETEHVEDSRKVPTIRIEDQQLTNNKGNLLQQPETERTLHIKTTFDHRLAALENSTSNESNYLTPEEGSDIEFADTSDIVSSSPQPTSQTQQYLDFPFIDEDSDQSRHSSQILTPRNIEIRRTNDPSDENSSENHNIGTDALPYEPEVIEISDVEYSADEEQEESEQSDLNEEQFEYETEDESEDEHVCDSNCEHSEQEIEDESDVDSEDHICDSDCEHSEVESVAESEYESDETNSERDSDHDKVIEISENEYSADEAQLSEDEILVCECDSNCPSDCDGNHHECSSECGCTQYQSDSDNEVKNSNNKTQLENNHTPSFQRRNITRSTTLPSSIPILNELSPQPKTGLTRERNNNRLQRNHSQRIPQHTNGDIMGELKTAIDARVKRTASCRETTTDYRKRYAHLSNDDSIQENLSKLDTKEREMRRKERRSRLRTLELKREQCLEEVRGGTENNVSDWIYRDASKQET